MQKLYLLLLYYGIHHKLVIGIKLLMELLIKIGELKGVLMDKQLHLGVVMEHHNKQVHIIQQVLVNM